MQATKIEWRSFHFLRKPNSDLYKEFQDVWEEPTLRMTDLHWRHCKSHSKESFWLSGEKVHHVLTCVKPRCACVLCKGPYKAAAMFVVRVQLRMTISMCAVAQLSLKKVPLCIWDWDKLWNRTVITLTFEVPALMLCVVFFSELICIPPEKSEKFQSIHPICSYLLPARRKEWAHLVFHFFKKWGGRGWETGNFLGLA